jgi:membrane-associated phospholipid phosphatase
VLLSWIPFLLALFLYEFARAVGYWIYKSDAGHRLIVTPQITADRFLGGGRLPTERLQDALIADRIGLRSAPMSVVEKRLRNDQSTVRWYDIVVAGVYTSHFVVPYLTAGYLWRKGQRIWRWYAATFVAVAFLCCAIFALAPTAPPWYAATKGLIQPFPRVLSNRAWSRIGIPFAGRVIDKGKGTLNPFAAIPSLHSADALMVSIFVWPYLHRWSKWVARPILFAFPLVMAFALVYSGEHYLVDVFAGWAMVGLVLAVGWRIGKRRGWANPFRDGPHLHSQRADSQRADSQRADELVETRETLGTLDEIAQVTS